MVDEARRGGSSGDRAAATATASATIDSLQEFAWNDSQTECDLDDPLLLFQVATLTTAYAIGAVISLSVTGPGRRRAAVRPQAADDVALLLPVPSLVQLSLVGCLRGSYVDLCVQHVL